MALKSWQASTDKINIRSNPSLLDSIGMDSQVNHEKNKKNLHHFSMVGEKGSKGSPLGKMGLNFKARINGKLGHQKHFLLCKSLGNKNRMETHFNLDPMD